MCTICKIFNALDNEAFHPLKIFAVWRKFLDQPRRHAAVKLIRFRKTFVEKRFGAEHAKIRKRATTEQNAVRSDETVIADSYRRRALAILLDIDAVGNDLGLESSEGREFADRDRIGAIDQMPVGDGRMFADDKFGPPVFLLGEVPRRSERKTGDPVAPPNRCVRFEMQEIDVLANGEMIDATAFLHD